MRYPFRRGEPHSYPEYVSMHLPADIAVNPRAPRRRTASSALPIDMNTAPIRGIFLSIIPALLLWVMLLSALWLVL
jgi:hypothetical protein